MHICAACHRHIRESDCPFCGANNADAAPVKGVTRVGIPRSSLLVAGAITAAVSGAGCAEPPSTDDVMDVVVSSDAVYGLDGGLGADVQRSDAVETGAQDDVMSPADVGSTDAGTGHD